MTTPHVEVHEVFALRVDANGRVGRLRITGVGDNDKMRIHVDVCVADLDRIGVDWVRSDQQATALARIVDPARTTARALAVQFRDLQHAGRRAFPWVAEIDVLLTPGVPPLTVGTQDTPVYARAYYIDHISTSMTKLRVLDLPPQIEFDVGVLLVHGIGMQRRSETLSQWGAPLARWINAWLKGATDEIASKLDPKPLESWRKRLTGVGNLSELDADYVDRATYANALERRAGEASLGGWRAEPKASTTRGKPIDAAAPSPSPVELDDCANVISRIDQEIAASAVGGSAEFRDAYVLDVGAHAFEPSSVEMHVEAMAPDGYMLRSRWMLAESHWAESFWAPSFFGFGRWCLLTAPIVLVHYIKLARLAHAMWLRYFASVLGLAIGVTLAQLAFALLTVLWLVPWQRLRAFVLRIQLGLAGIVGDSYVILQDPVQRRAIIDRVQRDLNWLVQRCRSVVVIAHSQGAYVAEQVLENRNDVGDANIKSFVTLGSGISTLSAIEKIARNRRVNIAGWVAIGSVLALAVSAALALAGGLRIAGVVAVASIAVLAAAAWFGAEAHEGRPLVPPAWTLLRKWFDFFASCDLVPFGPFLDPNSPYKQYVRKQVRNRDSLLSDHVLYWQNAEQVVGPIARLIGAAAAFKPLTALLPDDEATLGRLENARLSRLGFLAIARLVMLVATIVLLRVHWHDWFAIGFWAIVWVQSKLGMAIGGLRAPALDVWLGALVVLLPLLVHKTLVAATFDGWTNGEVERLLRRSAGSPATHWAAIFVVLLVIVMAATIQYVWPLTPAIAFGATVLAAVVLAWVARGRHRRKVGLRA